MVHFFVFLTSHLNQCRDSEFDFQVWQECDNFHSQLNYYYYKYSLDKKEWFFSRKCFFYFLKRSLILLFSSFSFINVHQFSTLSVVIEICTIFFDCWRLLKETTRGQYCILFIVAAVNRKRNKKLPVREKNGGFRSCNSKPAGPVRGCSRGSGP